jgi:uncharacterized membrane protein (UPF0127 family)
MAVLTNKTKHLQLSDQVTIAGTMVSRMIGLLGKSSLSANEMLWIKNCNSIHTFFMKFPIDCVFLNKNMIVCDLRSNVVPWRIIAPVFSARTVIEMPAGQIQALNIQVGDQLHVGT